jgi:hypothetical protein
MGGRNGGGGRYNSNNKKLFRAIESWSKHGVLSCSASRDNHSHIKRKRRKQRWRRNKHARRGTKTTKPPRTKPKASTSFALIGSEKNVGASAKVPPLVTTILKEEGHLWCAQRNASRSHTHTHARTFAIIAHDQRKQTNSGV